ncbi:MAG: diguanylate cyclase [Magnetococcales bacterium]|nr:diguanylate cyclase [Magnetococcales bacterium]
MKLQGKTTLLTLSFSGAMIALLIAVSLIAFRQFSLATAKEHVRASAEIVRVSLTESMINGSIDQREQFLTRLAEVDGLLDARVLRSKEVNNQFGEGLSHEVVQDDLEKEVLATGIPYFGMVQEGSNPVFRGTIPFVAHKRGTPNCLECHEVGNGTVLGAITIHLSMAPLKTQALTTIALMSLLVVVFSTLFTFFFRRQVTPVVETAVEMQKAVSRAKDGDFSGRVIHHSQDEVGEIARDLNRLMEYLQENLGSVSRDVARLIQYELTGNTNLLTSTTEMVDLLVEVAQFKQSIEEDQSKLEVYNRIARIMQDKFSIQNYSIYEVASSKNHMKPILVDGEENSHCRWCNQAILYQAGACRAQRTGHVIDSVESPHICNQFLAPPNDPQIKHICLPVLHSGMVGSVVQLVVSEEHARLVQLMVPFIQIYLRESASVVEAKRLMDTLRESALRDALTGLHNRRFLEEYVETLVATTKRKKNKLSILMLDLDHFKQVNDTYGHDAGDTVLKAFAGTLGRQVRTSDLVVRYGGEEFLIVLQEGEGYSGIKMAEKIRQAVEDLKIQVPGATLEKTVSIGVARFPSDGPDFWAVLKFADIALYQAKEEGRNRVVSYVSDTKKDS